MINSKPITPETVRKAMEAATSGPYKTHPVDGTRIIAADGTEIGNTCMPRPTAFDISYERMEANARLWAMAPDVAAAYLVKAEEIGRLRDALSITSEYLRSMIEDGCPRCGGDCSAANPPMQYCPIKIMSEDLAKATAALTIKGDPTNDHK